MSDSKNKGGRPLADINKMQFERLCFMQCTKLEMCNFFDVTDKTLEKWCKRTYKKGFSEVFKLKRQGGFTSLRRNQWKMSETSVPMAIWLGKQYLGQSDNAMIVHDVQVDDGLIEALNHSAKNVFDGGDDSWMVTETE